MASTRVISGVLVPNAGSRTSGSATVSFNPPAITGDASGVEMNISGANGDYGQPPGKVVSLREIRVGDKDTFFGGSTIDLFSINDDPPTADHMVVRWNTSGGGEIREISVLIIGDA